MNEYLVIVSSVFFVIAMLSFLALILFSHIIKKTESDNPAIEKWLVWLFIVIIVTFVIGLALIITAIFVK